MDESKRREADATSKETLEDLKQTEKVSDDTSSDDSIDESPSPDGALDETDDVRDAGPM